MTGIADDCSGADRTRVVLDNLSTHDPAAFYRFFLPEKHVRIFSVRVLLHAHARELAECGGIRLEFAPDAATLPLKVAAWETERNEMNVTVDLQFTAEDT